MNTYQAQRHFIYWRTLLSALATPKATEEIEKLTAELVKDARLPPLLLEPRASVAQVLRRHPELQTSFDAMLVEDAHPSESEQLKRLLLFSKTLLSVMGGNDSGSVSAAQYNRWLDDVSSLEQMLGQPRGQLMDTGRPMESVGETTELQYGGHASGGAPDISEEEVRTALDEMRAGRGLMSTPEIKNSLQHREQRLVERMDLTEILSDKKLAERVRPSMAVVSQLLRSKDRLSGTALQHAKLIIRRYVDELKEALLKEVQQATSGASSSSVPPKRTFRNLDVDRTIWKNLPNWDPKTRRLYVSQLHYHRRGRRKASHRLLVVVDQSGSMIPAMINCTILASIFAGLPSVDAHLIAFDTEVVDLTEWLKDPFEVLLRTDLGGGNDGCVAMEYARTKIVTPRETVMVWISDFYERRELFPMIEQVVRAGVTFIPVGSVSGSGYFSVDPWYRENFEKAGIPLMSGSLKTLIKELKTALP